jgi:hypothetical protein
MGRKLPTHLWNIFSEDRRWTFVVLSLDSPFVQPVEFAATYGHRLTTTVPLSHCYLCTYLPATKVRDNKL